MTVQHYRYPGALGGPQSGGTVEVKAGRDTSGLRLTLQPPGAVTGRVVDDDGLPVEGCRIILCRADAMTPVLSLSGETTNDKGEFRVERVPADRYVAYLRCNEALPTEHLLDVVPREGFEIRSTWLPVFYPDSETPDGAQVITVAPGLDPVLEFHLRATPVSTVTGSFAAGPGVAWTEPVNINLHLPGDGASGTYTTHGGYLDEKRGRFVIPTVPPGSYQLIAHTGPRDLRTAGATTFPVTIGDTAPKPFPVVLNAGVPVTGIVENAPGVRGIVPSYTTITENTATGPITRREKQMAGKVTLESVDAGDEIYVAPVQIDSETGRFSFPSVPLGRWRVHCEILTSQAYVDTIEFNEKRLAEPVLEIAANQSAALRVVLAKPPSVEFELVNVAEGATGQWTVLAREEPAAGRSTWEAASVGSPPKLSAFGAHAPGDYRLIALPYGVASRLDRDRVLDILAPSVDPIEITTSARQTVPVRCFSRADIEKAIRRYLYGDNPPPGAP